MKLTTSVFSALVALALSAQAATVTVGNLPGNVPVPISGTDGNLLGSGSVAIGVFSGDVGALAGAGDIAGLKSAFTQFGNSVSMGFNGLAGLYQNSVSGAIGAGDAYAGQNVYTVIGDGASIGDSNGLLVFDHGFSFQADPAPTDPAIITSDGNLLLGSAKQGDVGGTAFDGFMLAGEAGGGVIPEPSSALLGLIGLSALFFRRRK
jgi:hypothetical protein